MQKCHHYRPCAVCNAFFLRKTFIKSTVFFLAPKTLTKRSQKRKKVLCPKCKKLFVILGTHLKNSPTCKFISSTPPLGVSSAVSAMLTPPAAASISVFNQDAIMAAPHNSNSANTACGLPPSIISPQSTTPHQDHCPVLLRVDSSSQLPQRAGRKLIITLCQFLFLHCFFPPILRK